ncbi:alpha/beta fold hydrolase [Candidatus Odyssella acanthamoebae]|uniref:alpha/beta fold hydrolase n=1 Tax=Candidatus Odyssella acanthamoebae TaxID=91604 RepID=UPI00068F5874|nr:alpha/beta hydrolase [Candidatus Paracaedibacter acanthamoebae]
MKLICWHGWGYDNTFFAPLMKILTDVDIICVNEGYFGAPYIPPVANDVAIGIGHSQGFSRLIQTFPNLQGYVSLNGFTQFMRSQNFPNGTPKAMLGAMIQQYQRHPDVVLQTFYERTGHPHLGAPLHRNDELLRQNLTALRSLSIKLPEAPILAIAGTDDLITPVTLQQDCFSKLHLIENANHSLLPTHATVCATLIRSFIESIAS